MDGFMPHMFDGYDYPYTGWIWIGISWIVQLVIGYLVYKDAKDRQMNAVLWFILVILPMIGILFLVIYVIIRETQRSEALPTGKSALQIVDERYAKGEIATEEYKRMKEELKK